MIERGRIGARAPLPSITLRLRLRLCLRLLAHRASSATVAATGRRGGGRVAQMLLAPGAHHLGDRSQSPAVVGQRVIDPGRHDSVDLAMDDAGRFKLAELLREHPLADARDLASQLSEAERAGLEPEQNGQSSTCRRSRPGSPRPGIGTPGPDFPLWPPYRLPVEYPTDSRGPAPSDGPAYNPHARFTSVGNPTGKRGIDPSFPRNSRRIISVK